MIIKLPSLVMNTQNTANNANIKNTITPSAQNVSTPDLATIQKMANAIRALSIDAVQKANSGHPGMPMGMAEIAATLWFNHLRHDPRDPDFKNRDRFILSNGHGSMLLYSLLHLTGYDLSMDDLKSFRQLHSKTPGHPEFMITPGVETTTGPLGQGLANAVGMALAEKLAAREFNQAADALIDHHTYVFLGDGCLMEGISHEACSLAGTWGLGKLIAFYDDNGISIDGQVQAWFTDDTSMRFKAYGWNVIEAINGHDIKAIDAAIHQAKNLGEANQKPTMIICKTNIGEGSPNFAGTDKVHGAPLGAAEIELTKQAINWSHAAFEIADEDYQAFSAKTQGQKHNQNWQEKWTNYQGKYLEASKLFKRRFFDKQLPENWHALTQDLIQKIQNNPQNIATRKASQNAIEHFAPHLPELLGGSADLTSSNLTNWKDCGRVDSQGNGRHIHYGVREFAMSAVMNGLALYGAHIPFGGTFLTFSDYARNAIRMAALMKQRSIFVFTHDSIGLGEDGPTHQPVEHVASLRLIPNLNVWRPADDLETAIAWQTAIQTTNAPSALALSRQNLPNLATKFALKLSSQAIDDMMRGAYVLVQADLSKKIDMVMIATGSEVQIALELAQKMQGLNLHIVSMPCVDLFKQHAEKDTVWAASILPNAYTIAIEAGVTDAWYRYADQVFGIDQFGESAPANVLYDYFGLTAEKIHQNINI